MEGAFPIGLAMNSLQPKDPLEIRWTVYFFVIALSLLAGMVNFYRKTNGGLKRGFRLVEFIGEMLTSSLAGLLVYFFVRVAKH